MVPAPPAPPSGGGGGGTSDDNTAVIAVVVGVLALGVGGGMYMAWRVVKRQREVAPESPDIARLVITDGGRCSNPSAPNPNAPNPNLETPNPNSLNSESLSCHRETSGRRSAPRP